MRSSELLRNSKEEIRSEGPKYSYALKFVKYGKRGTCFMVVRLINVSIGGLHRLLASKAMLRTTIFTINHYKLYAGSFAQTSN